MTVQARHLKLVIGAVILSYLAFTVAIVALSWPIDSWSLQSAERFGDSFGSINSFFAAASTILIVATIVIQQHELGMQREELQLQRDELSRLVGSQQRQIHMDLLRHAIGDDELADVWSTQPGDRTTSRQNLYVNMIVSWWQEMYETDLLAEQDLVKLLEHHLGSGLHFRTYWEAASRSTMRRKARFDELAQAAYDRGTGVPPVDESTKPETTT